MECLDMGKSPNLGNRFYLIHVVNAPGQQIQGIVKGAVKC